MLIPIGGHPVDNELMGTSTTPRTLAVIDIENLCGGSEHVDRWQQYVHYLYEHYTSGISMPIIATGSHAATCAKNLWWTWRNARRLVRSGIDGADNALVDALNEPLAHNVDHIEIWSGDHAFTDIARQFTRNGIPVTVHAPPHGIARSLEHVATRVHHLTELSFMHTTPILDGAA